MTDKEPERYVSGEEYHEMHHSALSGPRGRKITVSTTTIAAVIVALVLCSLSFAGGIAYQKHHVKTAVSTRGSTAGDRFGGRHGGAGLGQVTAISTTSITVANQRTNASKTYAITSSTTITDNGQTVTTSDIKTGDTVIVTTSTSDTSTATRILVNPSFGGGFGGGGGGQSASPNPGTE